MDTLQALMTRRSVRSFTSQPVPEDCLAQMLRAAMQAPSAVNERPWHFIVITDRSILDEYPKYHNTAAVLRQSSVAILVCGDDTLELRKGCMLIDCANATMNLLLAAHGLGLGAVWLGLSHDPVRVEAITRLTKLPAHIHPISMVAVGYPAALPEQVDRFDPERIRSNFWA
jgi:nitroreductase